MPFYWSVEWLRHSENETKSNEFRHEMKNKIKDKTQKMKEWFIKTWLKVKNGLIRKKYSGQQYDEMRRDQEFEEFYQTVWKWNEELDLELRNELNEKTPLMYVNHGANKECIYSYYN